MAASGSGRSVLRLRELLSRYRGNFIAFKGIYLLSHAAYGGSVGIYAEKKLLENINLVGDVEQTVRGNTVNVKMIVRLPYHPLKGTNDQLSLQGVYLDKTYSDPADQVLNIQDIQGKLVYRLFFIP